MHASQILTVIAFAVSTTAASTSVSSLFVPAAAGADVTASVVAAGAQATTYQLEWQPTGADESLNYDQETVTATLTQGPSTAAFHLTDAGYVTWDFACLVQGNVGDCSQSLTAPGKVSVGDGNYAITPYLVPATIAAGVDLLTSAAATATTTTAETSATASDAVDNDNTTGSIINNNTGQAGQTGSAADGQDASTTGSADGASGSQGSSSQSSSSSSGQAGASGADGADGSSTTTSSNTTTTTTTSGGDDGDDDGSSAAGRVGIDVVAVALVAVVGVVVML